MIAKEELASIAEQIRKLTDSEKNGRHFLTAVRLLVREAIQLGAFSGSQFILFRDFFDVRHDAKPHHCASFAMLLAMKWLAEHRPANGLEPPNSFDIPKTSTPARATLRPHIELLASLIESTGQRGAKPTSIATDNSASVAAKTPRVAILPAQTTAHPPQANEPPNELLDELTGQQVKLLKFLWKQPHGVDWNSLPRDAFQDEDDRSDAAVKRALERLQKRLNEFYERFQIGIEINADTRRVKLEKPTRTNADK